MGPFGAGIHLEAGQQDNSLAKSAGHDEETRGIFFFIFAIFAFSARGNVFAFFALLASFHIIDLWQLLEVGQILVSSCRSFVDFEVLQADQTYIDTVELIIDPLPKELFEVWR